MGANLYTVITQTTPARVRAVLRPALATCRDWVSSGLAIFERSPRFRLWVLWGSCSAAIALISLADGFQGLDFWAYDNALKRSSASSAFVEGASKLSSAQAERAALLIKERPLLIAIDEASLDVYGRWPWSRATHATLLDQLMRDGRTPSVVAFDILFPEPERPDSANGEDPPSPLESTNAPNTTSLLKATQPNKPRPSAPSATRAKTALPTPPVIDADAVLAAAIARFPAPVLAASLANTDQTRWRWIKPREPLASSGLRLAHIHTETDPDGHARRYYPIVSMAEAGTMLYMGLSLLKPELAPKVTQVANHQFTHNWPDSALLRSPPDDWVDVVSFKDVVLGGVSPAQWHNRRVLVATTASGLGDQYVSPIYKNSAVVSGSDLMLAALYSELMVQQGEPPLQSVPDPWPAVLAALAAGICLLGLIRIAGVGWQLVWLGGVLGALAAMSAVMFMRLGYWMPPGAIVSAVLAVWLVWLVLKFRLGFAFITQLLQSVDAGAAQASGTGMSRSQGSRMRTDPASANATHLAAGDRLDAQIEAAKRYQAQRVNELDLLSQIIQFLPEATLVLTQAPNQAQYADTGDGGDTKAQFSLEMANQAAQTLIERRNILSPLSSLAAPQNLQDWLANYSPVLTQAQRVLVGDAAFDWDTFASSAEQHAFESGVECLNAQRQPYLIQLKRVVLQSEPLRSAASKPAESKLDAARSIAILTLTDLTVSNTLRQQRESSLNFLSHDLRSPQSTILALLDLERSHHPEARALFEKIEHQARRTLYLAEGFVNLTRAEQGERYQFALHNLSDVMLECVDELWAQAQKKSLHIALHVPEDEVLVYVDRTHMGRTLTNLLRNAIHHCPEHSTIDATVWAEGELAYCSIDDRGTGIESAFLSKMFQPFQQSRPESREGFGLGLAYVKTVVDQHRGRIEVHSPIYTHPSASDDVDKAASFKPHGTRFQLQFALAVDET